MPHPTTGPQAVFVVGSPRSGTTLVGSLVGSCSGICDLGEYGGFYFSHAVAPAELGTMPTPYVLDYLSSLRRHSVEFARSVAASEGASCYVDSTPWNLLVAGGLAAQLPDAVFILMIRHYTGVVQSLARSDIARHTWVGRNWRERAAVWTRAYAHVGDLPAERTIPVGYEALCRRPAETIRWLQDALLQRGVPADTIDLERLVISHASDPRHERPVIGRRGEDGSVSLHPIRPWDPDTWSADIQQEVEEEVRDVDTMLGARLPDAYWSPPGRRVSPAFG